MVAIIKDPFDVRSYTSIVTRTNWFPPEPDEPARGELVYAVALWQFKRKYKWRPQTLHDVPPITDGRFSLIWFARRSIEPVLLDVRQYNFSALAVTRGKRLKSWAVAVRAVYGFDSTARVVDVSSLPGKAVQR